MYLEIEEITPHRAQELIGASAGQAQRRLNATHVQRLARAMEKGEWEVTHQPIAVDNAGNVIDGQHRLHAVVLSNTTQRMLVAHDADPKTFTKIDIGKTRSIADALSIDGHVNVTRAAATYRSVLTYDQVVGTTRSFGAVTRLITNDEVVALANSERGRMIEQNMRLAQGVCTSLGRVGYSTWMGAAFSVIEESNVPRDLQIEFFTRLRDGAQLGVGSPILALRRYLTADTGLVRSVGAAKSQIGFATTLKTINAWLSGAERSLVVFRVGIEPMPRVVWDSTMPNPEKPQGVDIRPY